MSSIDKKKKKKKKKICVDDVDVFEVITTE